MLADGGFWKVGVLALALGAVGLVLFYALKTGVPPTPLGRRARRGLLALADDVAKHVAGESGHLTRIAYLGSAWGGLARALARRFPSARVNAFEWSPLPYGVSVVASLVLGQAWGARNLSFHRQDFFTAPLGDADLVVCYLFPDRMLRLKKKLTHEMKPGAWVLSAVFAVPGWTPVKVSETDDLFRSKLYLYRIGGDGQVF